MIPTSNLFFLFRKFLRELNEYRHYFLAEFYEKNMDTIEDDSYLDSDEDMFSDELFSMNPVSSPKVQLIEESERGQRDDLMSLRYRCCVSARGIPVDVLKSGLQKSIRSGDVRTCRWICREIDEFYQVRVGNKPLPGDVGHKS